MQSTLSPILLFTYNRPAHTKRTIEALTKNALASDSELFIYSDAPKNKEAEKQVEEVRAYLKKVDGFRKTTIIERTENWGLTKNLVDAVTKVVNQYGTVIVLEDDIVTSPAFLTFMNKALNLYEHKEKVWHISGWNYPINPLGMEDAFLWRAMNCWGWATWKNKWKHYEKNIDEVIEKFSSSDIYAINLDGIHDFWEQVIRNKKKEIDTWAIFWYTTIYKHNGLCLNPTETLSLNIGLDGSGIHCHKIDDADSLGENTLCRKFEYIFPTDYVESIKGLKRIQQHLAKPPLLHRAVNKIKRNIKALIKYYTIDQAKQEKAI